jgi:DNA-binding response OmpR family regulator
MNSTPRILAIDDEPLFLEIIVELLDDSGYEVETEESSLAAWERLQRDPHAFDILLLDWQMPELNGLDLLRRIKADDKLKHLAVVMQTALSDKARVAEGLSAGAFYYLVKPFEQQELRAIVDAAVADRRHEHELTSRLAADRRALGALHHAEFRIRTLVEARELGIFIANTCPESQRVVLGLTELLVNAVEHGNLELGYDDKSRLMEAGRLHDEIALRLGDPRYAARAVAIDYRRRGDTVEIGIVDEGPGFDWHRYLDFDPERAFHSHGRGIAMARKLSFDHLDYRGRGNEVFVTMSFAKPQPATTAAIAA